MMVFRSCPAQLEAGLTRAVLDEARANYLNQSSTSMSPTGTEDINDEKKNEKLASSSDLLSSSPEVVLRRKPASTPSATSTKGSQGRQE